MDYIILDLEWNQGSREKDRELTVEIVEIGAVKYNEQMEQISEFHGLIKPQIYREMHKFTEELIHLDMKELQSGEAFPEVMGKFLAWCREGEQFLFCTWGTQDLTELQRNMKYYGMEPLSDGPIPYLDVQKLFSIAYEDRKKRRALEFAVDYLQIEKDIPFHRAYSDAYYTGKVLARCNDPEVLKNVSYDVFHPPLRREDEVRVQFATYEKYISRQFDTKEDAFLDKEVVASKCYLCHCNLRKRIKWFTNNSKQYYCLAYCEKHGFLKGKIRVRRTDEDKVYIVKTTKFISEEDARFIAQRKDHVKEMRKKHRIAAKLRK